MNILDQITAEIERAAALAGEQYTTFDDGRAAGLEQAAAIIRSQDRRVRARAMAEWLDSLEGESR